MLQYGPRCCHDPDVQHPQPLHFSEGWVASAILSTTEQNMTPTWHEWLLIPKTQEWKIMGPMQRNLETRGKGEWWASMEEVFRVD